MKEFKGKVAVVTGAASGIGKGLAERCVTEGMHVVIADIETARLEETERTLSASGGSVVAMPTDVSRLDDIERLARTTLDAFGAVHLLFNNAGVGAGGRIWECTPADWEWTLGVNLWGVIYGIRTFVPLMIEQDVECHIVNTASIEGLWARPSHAPYQVSKHAVVCLSEVLYQDLRFAGKKVGVSVLCPGAVDTNIVDSWRNRPAHLQNAQPRSWAPNKITMERVRRLRESFRNGMSPAQCAQHVFEAISNDKLYILTHPDLKPYVRERVDNILNERNPDLDRVPMRPESDAADIPDVKEPQ